MKKVGKGGMRERKKRRREGRGRKEGGRYKKTM